MTLSVEEQLPYEGTSPRAYEHPADRAATAALAAIPLMDTVLKRLSDLGYERQLRQVLLGSAVRLGDSQLPSVWSGYCRSARLLDVEQLPELYITQTPLVNA